MDTTCPGRARSSFWCFSVFPPVSLSACGAFPLLCDHDREEYRMKRSQQYRGAMADSSCSSLLSRLLHPIRHLRTSHGTRLGSSLSGLPGHPIHVCLWSVGDCVDVVDLDLDIGLDLDLDTAMHSIGFVLNDETQRRSLTPIIVAHLVQGTFSKHRWTLVTFGAGTICE